MSTTRHTVEIEGKDYMVAKRTRMEEVSPVPGSSTEVDAKIVTEYSFDGEQTWHVALLDAYKVALKAGGLVAIGAPLSEGGEFEAFLISLIKEFSSLQPGESVKIFRTDTDLVVLKEQGVLAVKASTVKDVDLQMKEI